MSSLLFLDLNQDVLLHIAASLPRPTLASLSSGCRALRNLYSVHLLDGCVTVTTDTLLSFRSFLDADPTRLQYLRRLQFTGWGPDLRTLILLRMGFHPEPPMPKVDTGKHVMEILRMAHSLNFLSLLDMDTELFPPAELKSTLAQLPLLEHLYLGQTEDVHQDLIADILPNLRSVISQFRFIDRRIGNEDLETYHAFPGLPPLPLLRSHTNVLQSLSLCWVHLPKNLPPFPNVRRLELSLWSAPGGLRTLLTAFPNIEDLTIGPPRVDTVLDGSIFIQGEEEAATAEAQRASNRTLTSQWSRIRRIACVNALALYWLGLQYAVDQVEVREIDATSRMLETILNDLRPRCLTLLTHSRLMNLFVDPSKRTLNLLPQAPYVTHLVQLARVDRRERVRVLNTLAVHLRRSAVSHLLVAFEATAGEERFRWKEFDAQPETLTRLLTDAIPSLRYLFIQVGAHTPRLKGWMKHTTENGGWRELSSWVAHRLIVVEGLSCRSEGSDRLARP